MKLRPLLPFTEVSRELKRRKVYPVIAALSPESTMFRSLKFTREIKKCSCKRADRYISVAQIKVATQCIRVSQENKCELLLRNLYI